MRPVPAEALFGSGDAPRFGLCGGAGAAELASRFPHLVESRPSLPKNDGLIALVRPDGYLAASVPDPDWESLVPYLRQFQSVGSEMHSAATDDAIVGR